MSNSSAIDKRFDLEGRKHIDQLYTRVRVMHTGLLHTGTCTLGPRRLPRHLLTMEGIAFLPSVGGNVTYLCIK